MKYGLIGGKLTHSFSKTIHEQLGNNDYELLEISEENFHDYMIKEIFMLSMLPFLIKKKLYLILILFLLRPKELEP